ncbi:MAG: hypothetical protein K8S27_10890 [Candidatus Omnitrophica bacterium]|nr:hypothetical protein [Candidatus Omnitrophota bacterium]
MLSFFSNNALFLVHSRERMRSTEMFARILIGLFVIGIIFANAYFKEHYQLDDGYFRGVSDYQKVYVPWPFKMVSDLAVFQGFILLLFGSVSAYRRGRLERTAGTLDFHRASPTAYWQQVIGLFCGATSMEWVLFFFVFLFQVVVAFFSPVILLPMIMFHLTLALAGLIYQLLFLMIGLSLNPRPQKSKDFIILLFVFISVPLFYNISRPLTHHVTWIAAYADLKHSFDLLFDINSRPIHDYDTLNMFFGVNLPSFVLSFGMKFPLIVFIYHALTRRIARDDKPLLSRAMTVMLVIILLVLFLGSSFHYFLSAQTDNIQKPYRIDVSLFLYFVFILGIGYSYLVTPTLLSYKKELKRSLVVQDGVIVMNTKYCCNSLWMICFSVITAVFYYVIAYFLQTPLPVCCMGLFLLLSYVWFFSGLLEFFNLSYFRHKTILLYSIVLVLWVLLPILEMVTAQFMRARGVYPTAIISPVYGISYVGDGLMMNERFRDFSWYFLIIAWGVAIIPNVLSFLKRQQIVRDLRNEGFPAECDMQQEG